MTCSLHALSDRLCSSQSKYTRIAWPSFRIRGDDGYDDGTILLHTLSSEPCQRNPKPAQQRIKCAELMTGHSKNVSYNHRDSAALNVC